MPGVVKFPRLLLMETSDVKQKKANTCIFRAHITVYNNVNFLYRPIHIGLHTYVLV